jgi:hypothetical protein
MQLDKIKYLLFGSILICFPFFGSLAQEANPSNGTHWKIYKYNGRNAAGLSVDSLKNLPNIEIAEQTSRFFFGSADTLDRFNTPVWMGMIVGSCCLDGKARVIIFSPYGGFYWDKQGNQYFQVEKSKISRWMQTLGEYQEKLMESTLK